MIKEIEIYKGRRYLRDIVLIFILMILYYSSSCLSVRQRLLPHSKHTGISVSRAVNEAEDPRSAELEMDQKGKSTHQTINGSGTAK